MRGGSGEPPPPAGVFCWQGPGKPLARLIHVGMKRLMPGEDSGLAIGAEYEEA